MRTVKRQVLALNTGKNGSIRKLCLAYAKEKQHWLDILKKWQLQALLDSPRKIRDQFVKEDYKSRYGLQARHWKLALQDAIETWDKYWQSLFVQVKAQIRAKLQDEQERHYAYWLLKGYDQFAKMMEGNNPSPPFELAQDVQRKVLRFTQRVIKKGKGKTPEVKHERSVKFDANCYSIFNHKGRQYIGCMSLTRGKRIILPLLGQAKIEGNIAIVLKGENIELHVSQKINSSTIKEERIEAVDFGYTEVLTDSAGNQYGHEFGKILTEVSDSFSAKMKYRNKLHALEKKLRKTNPKKAKKIRKYNLGKKKQIKKAFRDRKTLEREINTSINALVKKQKPSVIVTEDLSHSFSFKNSRNMNRRLSSWTKGKIQERMMFKALVEGFHHKQVNAAYGSQLCPECGYVDKRNRTKDVFKCLYCKHEDVADCVAAKNYLRRYNDQQIGLKMPHSQVKIVLQERFKRRLEEGNTLTVPGKTLETVQKVSPPLYSEAEISCHS